jgi:hypothetical protein
MSKIKIRNFGPIKQGMVGNEWIEIKKVTLFIGNQGSGKSSVAKLISTFSWMEKALIRGDFQEKHFTDYNRFRKTYCAYHRIENYFFNEKGKDVADIEYVGQEYNFIYRNGKLVIKELDKQGELTQVMYIPAERNLVSSSKNAKQFKDFSPSLIDFVGEFDIAKQDLKEQIKLPVNNVFVEYDRLNDTVNIKGKGYKVKLTEASSGFQAIVPLFLVSKYYANLVKQQSELGNGSMSSEEKGRFKREASNIWETEGLSDEQKRDLLSSLGKKFNKSAFINIVEEPEQNLFPTSQKEMLYSLLELNNYNKGNKLILTTHSPYIVNYLTVAILADKVKKHKPSELDALFPSKSAIEENDVIVYELDEINGVIKKLDTYDGYPSDDNSLNLKLDEGNKVFSDLLRLL